MALVLSGLKITWSRGNSTLPRWQSRPIKGPQRADFTLFSVGAPGCVASCLISFRMANAELACVYASLILHDDGVDISVSSTGQLARKLLLEALSAAHLHAQQQHSGES